VHFSSGAVKLAGTVVSPRGRGPFPAIVFIHGSGPDSRENYRGQAIWFARHGVAALIYDKRGVGGSSGDWRYVHFSDLADDAMAAVQLLRSRPDIRRDRVGFWGGSNGGWVAPLAASRDSSVAFVITVSGAAWPPAELAKWRSVSRVRGEGFPDSIVQRVATLMDLQAALVRRDGWEGGWREYEAALALLGANDAIVPPQETAQRLRSLQKPNLTVCIITGANHSMSPDNSSQPVAEYWNIMDRWLDGVWNASDPARPPSNDRCT
jgi:alpha-beta hydrolase superfamily lysophospholipase